MWNHQAMGPYYEPFIMSLSLQGEQRISTPLRMRAVGSEKHVRIYTIVQVTVKARDSHGPEHFPRARRPCTRDYTQYMTTRIGSRCKQTVGRIAAQCSIKPLMDNILTAQMSWAIHSEIDHSAYHRYRYRRSASATMTENIQCEHQ